MADIASLLDTYKYGRDELDKGLQLAVKNLKAYYHIFYTNSPYPEVRVSISNTDDPSLPVDTFRAWFLGIFFVVIFSAVHQVQLFSLAVADSSSFRFGGQFRTLKRRLSKSWLSLWGKASRSACRRNNSTSLDGQSPSTQVHSIKKSICSLLSWQISDLLAFMQRIFF